MALSQKSQYYALACQTTFFPIQTLVLQQSTRTRFKILMRVDRASNCFNFGSTHLIAQQLDKLKTGAVQENLPCLLKSWKKGRLPTRKNLKSVNGFRGFINHTCCWSWWFTVVIYFSHSAYCKMVIPLCGCIYISLID